MAASGNIDVLRNHWPRWLLAVIIGAPVTVGIGYYYFKKRSDAAEVMSKVKDQSVQGTSADSVGTESNSSTRPEPPAAPRPQTPSERSQQLKNAGNQLFKSNDHKEAIKCYTEALSLCPPNEKESLAIIYQNRAAAHEALNNTTNVLEDCNQALELNPSYIKALTRRCKAAEKLGNLKLALEDVTAICILERFENMNTLNQADKILKQFGAELAQKEMSNRALVMCSKQFVKSHFQGFVHDPIGNSLKEERGQSGDAPISGLMAAKIALAEGRYQDVIQCCNEQIAMDIQSGDSFGAEHYLTLLLRGTMFYMSTVPQRSLPDFNTIITDKPSDKKVLVTALIKRATLYLQMDKMTECLEDFNTALEIDPENCDIYYHRGQVHLYCDNLEGALDDYEKAVKLQPDFPLAVVQRLYSRYRSSYAKHDIQKTDEAAKAMAAAAEKYSDIPEGFLLLGQVYADQHNFEEAAKAFDKVKQRTPICATTLVHKGLLELQWHNDAEKAIEYLEEALAIDQKCEFALETLASIEVQRGHLARAVELFEKALALAKSEKEVSHLCTLKAAAESQQVVIKRLGIPEGLGIKL